MMSEVPQVAYCISCTREFYPASPDIVLCPDCGGPPEGSAPADQGQTLLEPSPGVATPLQPLVKPATERIFAESDVRTEWQPGDTLLDTYTVSGMLGEGGMGKVYRVHHKSWNIDLAVKSPRHEFFQTQEQRDLFISEAETWVNLGLHPHIVSCYYVRNLGGVPRVFAELVEGGSLADWITEGRITTLEQVLDIAIQFAWGLAYAHEQGLVHRDVKPANALMTPEGTAKVTDFGLTKAGKGMTPAYASPEQAEAQLKDVELTLKSDIWSWALSVLEMVAGRAFWIRPEMPDYTWGQVAPQALEHYLSGELEDTIIAKMSVGMPDLLRECFQKNPADRPDSLDIVAERLVEMYATEFHQPYPRQKPKAADLRADSLNNKGLSFLDIGKDQEAVETWQRAIQLNPLHAEATYNLGLWRWKHAQQTDIDFINQLEAVTRAQADTWIPYYLLGSIHKQRQDIPTARQAFEEASKLAPGMEQVQAAIQRLDDVTPAGCIHIFEGRSSLVNALAISPKKHQVICGIHHWNPRVWDLDSGTCIFSLDQIRTDACFITPDGQTLVTGDTDGILRIWDLTHETSLFTLPDNSPLTITPDGRLLISISKDNVLKIWDLKTGTCLHTLENVGRSRLTFTFTPDGRQLIYSIRSLLDHALRVYDLNSGVLMHKLEGHTDSVNVLAVTPDSRLVLSGGEDSTLRVWELTTGECLHTFRGHKGPIRAIAITPDGHRVISGGRDSTLRLRELDTWKSLQTIERLSDGVTNTGYLPGSIPIGITTIALTPDEDQIVTGSEDHTIRIWDISSGSCLRTLQGHQRYISKIAFSPKKDLVISSSDDEIRVWRLPVMDQKQIEWAVNFPSTVRSVQVTAEIAKEKLEAAVSAISRNAIQEAATWIRQVLLIPTYEKDPEALKLWHEAGQRAGYPSKLQPPNIQLIIKGASNPKILKGGRNILYKYLDNTLRFFELDSGTCIKTMDMPTNWNKIYNITPDWSKVVTCSEHADDLQVWDLERNEQLSVLKGHSGEVRKFSLTQNRRQLISIGKSDNTIRIWDLNRGCCLHTLEHPVEGRAQFPLQVLDFVIHPDDRTLITASQDKTARIWDMASGLCIRTLRGHTKEVGKLAITPDGQQIISSSKDNTIRLWNFNSGECINKIFAVNMSVFAITPDGCRIVFDSYAGKLEIWDLHSDQRLHILQGHETQHPHTSGISVLIISPDGRHVVTGGKDTKLKVWDLIKGTCLYTLDGHTNAVSELDITCDGRYLVSGSRLDNALLIWTLDWDYEFPDPTDWNEGARPYCEIFINLHTPFAGELSKDRQPTENEITFALTRRGKPTWTEDDFQQLLVDLAQRGYGWLRPEGVRRKLEEMAAERCL